MFDGIGVLSSNSEKFFCILLLLVVILQDGIKSIFSWKEACPNNYFIYSLEGEEIVIKKMKQFTSKEKKI